MSVPMIVPPLDEDGEVLREVDGIYLSDDRVPHRVDFQSEAAKVRPASDWRRDAPCNGRHLFDVLESRHDEYETAAEAETYELAVRAYESDLDSHAYNHRYDDDSWTRPEAPKPAPWSERFRAVLTCVRCGLVQTWDGRRDTTYDRITPEPLRAGTLRAQQTRAKDYSEGWLVHDASGTVVGIIAQARGSRGRKFYQGRLADLSPSVDGPTPLAVLRKLAKSAAL